MIMPKSSDLLHLGACPAHGLRWVHADVCDSARLLGQNHLCGPAAGLVLAEALGGVALLSGELTEPDETVSLRLQVSGPVEGVLVEAARDGALRGYPHIKVLDDLDDLDDVLSGMALGERGQARIVRSRPGRLLSQAVIELRPATVPSAVERYFAESLQRVAFVVHSALTYDGFIDLARALLIECLPGGDRAEFERLRHRADDGSLREALESAPGIGALCEELGLRDARVEPPRPLRFACRCTMARAAATLAALPLAELEEMAAAGRPADLHCHMCGKHYAVSPAQLAHALAARRGGCRENGLDAS
jgi:molecular chaperone Hsp33